MACCDDCAKTGGNCSDKSEYKFDPGRRLFLKGAAVGAAALAVPSLARGLSWDGAQYWDHLGGFYWLPSDTTRPLCNPQGCGAAGGQMFPSAYGLASWAPCCDKHDCCWHGCASEHGLGSAYQMAHKEACDDELGNCIFTVCWAAYLPHFGGHPEGNPLFACFSHAVAYREVMRTELAKRNYFASQVGCPLPNGSLVAPYAWYHQLMLRAHWNRGIHADMLMVLGGGPPSWSGPFDCASVSCISDPLM